MTTWTDYEVPRTMIPTGDGIERPVRGLSVDDLSLLIVDNLDTMMQITTLYIQSQKDIFSGTNMSELLLVAARDFPGFLAEVISMVTDEPSLAKKKLPVILQLTILQAAIKLTIEDAGGLGNLSAILQTAVKAAVAGRGEVSQKLAAILSQNSTTVAGKTRTS